MRLDNDMTSLKFISLAVPALLVTLLFINFSSSAQTSSPDKRMVANVYLNEHQQLKYSVIYNGNRVIEPSDLGFTLNDINYGKNVEKIRKISNGEVHETRQNPGKAKALQNLYNYQYYKVVHPEGDYILQVRLYNEGFAYRYIFKGGMENHINQEHSSWKIPKGSKVWYFERDSHWKLKSYAGLWMRTDIDSLQSISSNGPVQGKPLLFELPHGKYMMVTEAALTGYSGMRLKATGDRVIKVNFTEGKEGFTVQGDLTSPWRVALLADDLNSLVNSDVIAYLNPLPDPQLFESTEWVKPGRAVWSWWSRDSAYMTPENERKYIDYAEKLDFEYALLDEGWERWLDKWRILEEICAYASKRGVGVWVWKHSKALKDPEEMRVFLDSVKLAGAVGVKVDFMNSEAKEWIDFDLRLLEEAAKRQLVVNFHGCQASTGEYVTFPNELTREGVRGVELNIMGDPIPAWHNAALPFTRFVTGHADYTPLSFSHPGETTWAHQLATAYVFDSPFQCMAEDPAFIFDTPGLQTIIPLLKSLPVVWDETIVLPQSEIGKLALFARRKNDTWYLIALNGEPETKQIEVTPEFLEEGRYEVGIWKDGTKDEITYREKRAANASPILLKLKSNGGTVVRFLNK